MRCRYDDNHGRHCAVGWILVTFKIPLPQESTWKHLIDEKVATRAHRAFIEQLQSCHDMAAAGNDMKSGFIHFAKRNKLTFPEECL